MSSKKKAARQDFKVPDPHPNNWYREYKPKFQVQEQPLNTRRPLRLVVIGAGAAGLLVAYQAARQLRDVSFVVYEKNDNVGGTWYENRYPGLEVDSPSHCYRWSFRPNPDWSRFMSSGNEVWRYFRDWAVEDGIMKDVRLRHRVMSAVWNEENAAWEIKGVDEASGRPFEDGADILFCCNGTLNNPKFPAVPGIEKFKGQLIHSARWPDNLDLRDKTVAIIGGSGASGVQMVPAVQPQAKKLIVYLRSKFWAVSGIRSRLAPTHQNFDYTSDQKEAFAKDADLASAYYKDIEEESNHWFRAMHLGSTTDAAARRALHRGTVANFGGDEAAAAHYLPSYGLGCRRTMPVQDFVQSLQSPNVEPVQAGVVGFTETGIIDSDGGSRHVDVAVCATSFHASTPAFELIGRAGRNWADEVKTDARSYLGFMNNGFPNMFYLVAANAPVVHGTILGMIEFMVRYGFKLIAHMQQTSLRSFEPRQAAVDDYYVWTHQMMKRLTVSEPCHSWFKSGGDAHGPVTAVYAGSRAHFFEALMETRLEDFEVDYLTGNGREGNRFAYLGNGFARVEGEVGMDETWYIEKLQEEARLGKDAYEINPSRRRRAPADRNIVLPRDSKPSKL